MYKLTSRSYETSPHFSTSKKKTSKSHGHIFRTTTSDFSRPGVASEAASREAKGSRGILVAVDELMVGRPEDLWGFFYGPQTHSIQGTVVYLKPTCMVVFFHG